MKTLGRISKRNINSLRQDSRQHAGQLPIYIKTDGPHVSTLHVRLPQSVCNSTEPRDLEHTRYGSLHSMEAICRPCLQMLWLLFFVLSSLQNNCYFDTFWDIYLRLYLWKRGSNLHSTDLRILHNYVLFLSLKQYSHFCKTNFDLWLKWFWAFNISNFSN